MECKIPLTPTSIRTKTLAIHNIDTISLTHNYVGHNTSLSRPRLYSFAGDDATTGAPSPVRRNLQQRPPCIICSLDPSFLAWASALRRPASCNGGQGARGHGGTCLRRWRQECDMLLPRGGEMAQQARQRHGRHDTCIKARLVIRRRHQNLMRGERWAGLATVGLTSRVELDTVLMFA